MASRARERSTAAGRPRAACPELVQLPEGESLHRFYTADYHPIFFDRSDLGRFNAPDGSYGMLNAAQEIAGAFAETFLRTPGRTLIDIEFLQRKGLCAADREATADARAACRGGIGKAWRNAGSTAWQPAL